MEEKPPPACKIKICCGTKLKSLKHLIDSKFLIHIKYFIFHY